MHFLKLQIALSTGFCFIFLFSIRAQEVSPSLLDRSWNASWIVAPDTDLNEYGVYLFRKAILLNNAPKSYVIHVSADNRYKLFVNEKLVSLGPARGDLSHWNFETVDISSYLKSGENQIAAQVWNEGPYRPEAQISLMTAFILQGASELESDISTNASWKVRQDESYAPLPFRPRAYYVAGPGEIRKMSLHPKGWKAKDFDDKDWQNAQILFRGIPKNVLGPFGTTNGWMLKPSDIPQMERKDVRLTRLVRAPDELRISKDFPQEKSEFSIAPNSSVTLLLDQSYLVNAYPRIFFSNGKNASISIAYAEALYSEFPEKGNRNDTADKIFIGRTDSLISDGSKNQEFTSLSYRTFRYVQLKIQTRNEALIIHDLYSTFTGYPFELKAHITSQNQDIQRILNIGWRTARLCATETYMDCPYYEQLQYIGDARIQAMVSLYNSGDDRLIKNAINLMDYSRQPEGITLSRHPSYTPQYIPTFSLWYIGMLHDYSRYGSDINFAKSKIAGTRMIIEYFEKYQQADGSLKNVPQWMFTDWVEKEGWNAGVGPMSKDGTSGILDLQLLLAYQTAAELESQLGMPEYTLLYEKKIKQLKETIQKKYWDDSKKLFADRQEKDEFSQHSNILAILTGLVDGTLAEALSRELLTNKNLAPASIYFKYYLHQALTKAGLGNEYLNWLGIWKENIDLGMSTWGEDSNLNSTRSDCHAWGSSPNIEFYRIVLGIDSDGPGFSNVKIEPHLGNLKNIGGEIPHPNGKIEVDYQLNNNRWTVAIILPENVTGTFIWRGRKMNLKNGKNEWIFNN